MTRLRKSVCLMAAALAAAAGATALGAGTAAAGTNGTLGFDPSPTGRDDNSESVITSGPCQDPNATNIIVKMSGSGFPQGGVNVVGNSPISAYNTTDSGGYIVPLADTLQSYAQMQNPPATYNGRYDFILTCRRATNGTDLGNFTGSIYFTDPKHYQIYDPNGSQNTTTTLAASPSSPAPQGTEENLTATETPFAPGTVKFFDGTTAIGDPKPVNTQNGQATTTTTLAPGPHSLTAQFTPSIQGVNASTSGPVTYTVNPAAAPPPAVPEGPLVYAVGLVGLLGVTTLLVRRRREAGV